MSKEIKLSDGKLAVIKDDKGLDLLNAQKKAKTSDEIPYALIAELTEIDGKYLVYEDILELPIEDVILLQEAIGGKLQSKASAYFIYLKLQGGRIRIFAICHLMIWSIG